MCYADIKSSRGNTNQSAQVLAKSGLLSIFMPKYFKYSLQSSGYKTMFTWSQGNTFLQMKMKTINMS